MTNGNFLELHKLKALNNKVINKFYIEKEMTLIYTSPE